MVNELGLYINYTASKGFKTVDFTAHPILVHYSPKDAELLDAPMLLTVGYQKTK